MSGFNLDLGSMAPSFLVLQTGGRAVLQVNAAAGAFKNYVMSSKMMAGLGIDEVVGQD